MEVFSYSSLSAVHILGLVTIVVIPWVMHGVNRGRGVSIKASVSRFFRTTTLMWIVTPFVGIFFAAFSPNFTQLEVGQYVMACLVLFVTGGVMGFISLMVHFSLMEWSATKRA